MSVTSIEEELGVDVGRNDQTTINLGLYFYFAICLYYKLLYLLITFLWTFSIDNIRKIGIHVFNGLAWFHTKQLIAMSQKINFLLFNPPCAFMCDFMCMHAKSHV